jgi:cell cycle checkpoint protein
MQALLAAQFKQPSPSPKQTSLTLHSPSKDVVDAIIASSKGDIRSAIMALQFACVHPSRTKGKGTKRGAGAGAMIALTNREQSLQLFHLMGKILYNKRWLVRSCLDSTISDEETFRKRRPTKPVCHSQRHQAGEGYRQQLKRRLASPSMAERSRAKEQSCKCRSTSVAQTNLIFIRLKIACSCHQTLYADTPIDSSLLGLYIHQNYTQFCDEIEHCDGVSEWLSWVDCNAGEVVSQSIANSMDVL